MAHQLLKLKILTPGSKIYEGEVTRVTVPTVAGEITVYARHTPLVGLLRVGELAIEKEGEFTEWFAVSTGIIEVRPNSEVVILADTSEHAADIDIDKAIEARKRAKEAITKGTTKDVSLSDFEEIVEWEMARIRAHEKHYKSFHSNQ